MSDKSSQYSQMYAQYLKGNATPGTSTSAPSGVNPIAQDLNSYYGANRPTQIAPTMLAGALQPQTWASVAAGGGAGAGVPPPPRPPPFKSGSISSSITTAGMAIPNIPQHVGAANRPDASRFSVSSVPPPPQPPRQQQQQQKQITVVAKPIEYPPNLTEYIKKSFFVCENEAQRAQVKTMLNKVISRVTQEGRLQIHNWETEPIPSFASAAGMIMPPPPPPRPLPQSTIGGGMGIYGPADSTASAGTYGYGGDVDTTPSRKKKSRFDSVSAGSGAGPTESWPDKWVSPRHANNNAAATTSSAGGINMSNTAFQFPAASADPVLENMRKRKIALALEEINNNSNNNGKKNKNSKTNTNSSTSSSIQSNINATSKEELAKRAQRMNRFAQPNSDNSSSASVIDSSNVGLSSSRAGGKKLKGKGNSSLIISNNNNNNNNAATAAAAADMSGADFDIESLKIVGTCQKLDKEYLRLTSPPLASAVRPEAVLRKSIQMLKKKWANDEMDYVKICSQFKSIRQDLTVQHIKNDFTVHVYETHARVALECDDLNEYNQCQTQLKQLYVEGFRGCEMEFLAYRILYYVYLTANKKYTLGSCDLAFTMQGLTEEALKDANVTHAMQIRRAIQQDNYHRFFSLYRETPNMGNYILDLMIDTWRVQALQKIVKAYKPSISAAFVVNELAFYSEEEGLLFLRKTGCILVAVSTECGSTEESVAHLDASLLDINTKDSVIDIGAIFTQEKLLL